MGGKYLKAFFKKNVAASLLFILVCSSSFFALNSNNAMALPSCTKFITNCHPTDTTCPSGDTGTPPNCQAVVAPTCSVGYSGVYPNCLPNTQISIKSLPQVSTDSSEIKLVLNILFGVIGGISLLIITLSGFRYIISRGEPQEIAQAKNTIIYALIGMVIALLAFSIVNFVVGSI